MLSKKVSLDYFLNHENLEILRLTQQIINNEQKIHALKVASAKRIFDALYRLRDINRRTSKVNFDAEIWYQNLCAENDIDTSLLPLNSYSLTEDAYRKPKDISYFQTIPCNLLPEIASHFPEVIKPKQFNPVETKIQQTISQLRLLIGAKNLAKELEAILQKSNSNPTLPEATPTTPLRVNFTEFRKQEEKANSLVALH